MPAPTSVPELLDLVRRSQLLAEPALDEVLNRQRRAGTLPNTIDGVANLLVRDSRDARESVMQATTVGDELVLRLTHPLLHGAIHEELRCTRGGDGLVARSLTREVVDHAGSCLRREHVLSFAHGHLGLPQATYPEVALPFLLGWMPADGRRRSVYAWINDRFVAKVYVEAEGRTRDGPVRLRIPPGTSSGRRLRVPGHGVPSANGAQEPGDLIVETQIVLPALRDERSRELMKEFGRLNDVDVRREMFET